jgi:hypothetical protein
VGINRELTKNILRNRTCKTCERLTGQWRGHNKNWCVLTDSKPELDVCSQWKMKWHDKHAKNQRHKQKIVKKRKAKRK